MPDGKQPYAIARQDEAPLAMAGIWEGWRSPDGEVLRTFTILTTSVNATMRQLHERMPVVFEPDAWATWLGGDAGEAAELMRPDAGDVLRLWPVSRAVNSVRNNGPELLDRIDDPAAPPPSDAPAGGEPSLKRRHPDKKSDSLQLFELSRCIGVISTLIDNESCICNSIR